MQQSIGFKKNKLINIYSSLQLEGENLSLLPADISKSMTSFKPLNGLNFYRIAPREHTLDEILNYQKNGIDIKKLLDLLIENSEQIIDNHNAPSRNMKPHEVDSLMKRILEQLNIGITSHTEIARKIYNNPIVDLL